MSTETQEVEMGTRPTKEHDWLQNLVGDWRTEAEMMMPDGGMVKTSGQESVKSLGGLWAYAEGKSKMPDGAGMEYIFALGYDVTFKEYKGCRIMPMSSHLWKYDGKLSADGKVMTLDCEGPNMEGEGTVPYRDVITLIDKDHRAFACSVQMGNGEWVEYLTATLIRQ